MYIILRVKMTKCDHGESAAVSSLASRNINTKSIQFNRVAKVFPFLQHSGQNKVAALFLLRGVFFVEIQKITNDDQININICYVSSKDF